MFLYSHAIDMKRVAYFLYGRCQQPTETEEATARSRLARCGVSEGARARVQSIRETEIENLKLLILKLKRMHFGQRSEKFNRRYRATGTQAGRSRSQSGGSRATSQQPAAVAIK